MRPARDEKKFSLDFSAIRQRRAVYFFMRRPAD